jgi:hypothetical protein
MAVTFARLTAAVPLCTARATRVQSAHVPLAFRLCSGPRSAPPLRRLHEGPSAARRAVIVASSDIKFQGLDQGDGAPGSDYTSLFALAAFAASYFDQIHINVPFLLKAFAWYTLLNAASALIFQQGNFDKIGTVVAPAVLAASITLKQYDAFTITVGLIGWYLARELKGLPFWGWVSTLVAALYFSYGTHWVVGAYAFATLTRLLDGLENNNVPVVSVPILAVSVFAVLKEYKSLWVVCLALGEVTRSFYNLAKSVKDEEPKGITEHD